MMNMTEIVKSTPMQYVVYSNASKFNNHWKRCEREGWPCLALTSAKIRCSLKFDMYTTDKDLTPKGVQLLTSLFEDAARKEVKGTKRGVEISTGKDAAYIHYISQAAALELASKIVALLDKRGVMELRIPASLRKSAKKGR